MCDNLIISKNLQNQSQVSANLVSTNKLLVNGVEITSGGGGTNYNTASSIAIGLQAGVGQQTLAIAIGYQAAQTAQSSQAIAIGSQAGYLNQQYEAVALGQESGVYQQGTAAIAVGLRAGFTGQSQCGISCGYFSGYTSQGTQAIAIGYKAAFWTQGQYAIAIGSQAGQTLQGQNAIAIGQYAGRNAQPANSIVLNALGTEFTTNPTNPNAFYVAPVRSVGTSNASSLLTYDTTSNEIQYATNITMSGTIAANSYFSTSDARLKTNIQPFPPVLEKVKNLRPVKFDWKSDGRPDYGFIAQHFYDEMDFLKDAHHYSGEPFPRDASGSDVFYTMEYHKITSILCKAIQELDDKFEKHLQEKH